MSQLRHSAESPTSTAGGRYKPDEQYRRDTRENVQPSGGDTQFKKKDGKWLLYIYQWLVTGYLLFMFSCFTLFLSQKYAQARHDKFYLFIAVSGLLFVLLIGGYVALSVYSAVKGLPAVHLPFSILPFSVTDIAVLCFTGFALVSTVISKYYPGTIIAEFGRNNGMLLLLFYALIYFIITRLYVQKDFVVAVFLIFSGLVALLTVLNFFYIDPLGIFEGYDAKTIEDFGSTIGNKNTIASYMALYLPVAMMTLTVSEKRYMRVIAGVSVAFAYMGALCANSSSVFLGLLVAIPVMAIFSARRYDHLMRYMLALTIMFASGKVLRLFSFFLDGKSKGFEFIQHFLIYDKLSYIPIVVTGLLFVLMLALRKRVKPHYPAKAIMVVLITLTVLALGGALGAVIYFSVVDTTTPLGNLERLLRFDDRWGTHRGFMWIRAVQEYGKFDIPGILFGTGPDTAYFVMEPHFGDLLRYGDSSTNTVHNEYLNYLITQGALGLLSYLTILGSVIVRSIRRTRQDPTALIFISAVICYAAQSAVNLYQPITTPLFFIFIAMAEAMNRKNRIIKSQL